MSESTRKRQRMEDSATYQIRVQGCLEEVWSERLANMIITMDLKDQHVPVSILQGMIRDQSELLGVLNGLYTMRVPILSLEILDKEMEMRNASSKKRPAIRRGE